MPLPSLAVQLESHIREHISTLYEGWTICDDPTCRNRTRMMGVYGRRCLRPSCQGNVAFEVRIIVFPPVLLLTPLQYSDARMYNQLRYYAYVFDVEKAVAGAPGPKAREELQGILATQGELLDAARATVEKYLAQCGRRWVDLSSLFSFIRIK